MQVDFSTGYCSGQFLFQKVFYSKDLYSESEQSIRVRNLARIRESILTEILVNKIARI